MTDMTAQRVVLEYPGMHTITPRPHAFDGTTGVLTLDAYYPIAEAAGPLPSVVFVSGYPGAGFAAAMGCAFKDMGAYVSWSQLVASAGMVGITYENVDPEADARAVIGHLRANAGDLGLDPDRIAIWACSGNVPVALALLTVPEAAPACAALCYGYLMDLDRHTEVAEAAAAFRFMPAMAGRSPDQLARVPTLLVRAGRDQMPGLNDSMDRFVAWALGDNFPLSLVNYPEGPHAFDLTDPGEVSRSVIERIVGYLKVQLAVGG